MAEQDQSIEKRLYDLIATKFLGYKDYKSASANQKSEIRTFVDNLDSLFSSPANLIDKINRGLPLDPTEEIILNKLIEDIELKKEFLSLYVSRSFYEAKPPSYNQGGDISQSPYIDYTNSSAEYELDTEDRELWQKVDQLINLYVAKQKEKQTDSGIYIPTHDEIERQMKEEFGPNFQYDIKHLDTYDRLRSFLIRNDGKFRSRDNNTPASVKRWEFRVGAAKFFVPPTSIRVSQQFRTGSMGGVIRQSSSPKFNSGHSDTLIDVTLYFPNHETIWGFKGDDASYLNLFNWDPVPESRKDKAEIEGQNQSSYNYVSDEAIDYYLSSLRGLVVQFKHAPFLPVKNEYLNRTYDITAVTLLDMSIATVEGFPFVLAVNLRMSKFNHKAYLPMIEDFDQAIHWGKFRQYMGRATARLDSYVNQGFLTTKDNDLDYSQGDVSLDDLRQQTNLIGPRGQITTFEGDLLPKFNKVEDLRNGKFFEFYYPKGTPARIFAPDTTDFTQPGEDEIITQNYWDAFLSSLGLDVVESPDLNLFDYDRAYTSRFYRQERWVLLKWLELNNIFWRDNGMNSESYNRFVNESIAAAKKDKSIDDNSVDEYRQRLNFEWFFHIYEQMLKNDKDFKKMAEAKLYQNGKYILKEWKIPMDKLNIDWTSCIVNGVSVNISNNIASLQLQMQDGPVHQHLGSGDSRVDVSMIILGEDNLIKFRRLFTHIGGLARLEQAHGVLGFLGIKNVITSLCGIKYVLPLSFEVDTIPNFPHAYNVRMSLVDFDVFQQKREQLSSAQQLQLVEMFGKRNPFLRLKQVWSAYNSYPDLPLDVRDEDGEVLGHLDPDWYFRSFTTKDEDLFSWGIDSVIDQKVSHLGEILEDLETRDESEITQELIKKRNELEKEIREFIEQGLDLPEGWVKDDNDKIVPINPNSPLWKSSQTEYDINLGIYGKDNNLRCIIEYIGAGKFKLVQENIKTGDRKVNLQASYFSEDLASKNHKYASPAVPGAATLYDYQNEYWEKSTNPNKQYELMMKDWLYRNLKGRMVKAFPTYMLWLIDEGGRFGGVKLYDNFYGLNSVVDFSVQSSEDALSDTLVLRLSNIYQRLNTPYRELILNEDDPLWETPTGRLITTAQNRMRNIASGLTNEVIEIDSIRLKPGVRLHLRAGYGSNPNSLQTIFNGTITEVEQGDIMTVIAQSDAVELTAMVNTTNSKGHSGTLDGGINTGFWLSEPRDLMVRLLSMGSSFFKEWLAWGSRGVIFSDSRFGIRHFGNILYQEMTPDAAKKHDAMLKTQASNLKDSAAAPNDQNFQALIGDMSVDMASLSPGNLSPLVNTNILTIMSALWTNSFKKRDYEIFKRNIYPGNGFGIAQFMAGDMIDAGITVTSASAFLKGSSNNSPTSTAEDLKQKAAQVAIENKKIIDEVNNLYEEAYNINDTQLLRLINENEYISSDIDYISPEEDQGGLTSGDSLIDALLGGLDKLHIDEIITKSLSTIHLGNPEALNGIISFGSKTISSMKNIFDSPLARLMGITSIMNDDDLAGFDEVSFRAQTYMKSVWDLFQTCAALLPNYIVAVRPFEERSTVFYGKPHWLYTSGVIPLTSGLKIEDQTISLEPPDTAVTDLLDMARKEVGTGLESIQNTIDLVNQLNRQVVQDPDPYSDRPISLTPPEGHTARTDFKWLDEIMKANGNNNSIEVQAEKKSFELASKDPLNWAYHFGWKYPNVPAFIDTVSGWGLDRSGVNTLKILNANTKNRSVQEYQDIWHDFRKDYPKRQQVKDIWDKGFALAGSIGGNAPVNNQEPEAFQLALDYFMKFMWQIPENRAWVATVADKNAAFGDAFARSWRSAVEGLLGEAANDIAGDQDNSRWFFDEVDKAWEKFILSNDLALNPQGLPYSVATISWIRNHKTEGKDASNPFTKASEWLDEHFGDVFQMISNTLTGFVATLRISMAQLGYGLKMAGLMQQQANQLNSAYNDSIYYKGSGKYPGSQILKMADNPFTREYGEPVVEVREPFQRVHFLSSFENILDNRISENSDGVYTAVTAVSDGKYPVTVHFDKGVPPERQSETVVETGLFWDNAIGGGIMGMFQPLIHPLEVLRSVAKTATGSSDQLSSRRVALYHLKESLKDIYSGELLVLGDTDIRPHDLVFIADVYERMYGMFEVEKVIHHFTPDMGFITSITPNAIVTINDPGRWSMISYMWSRWANYNLRSDTRSMLAIKAERESAALTKEIDSEEIYSLYNTQMNGSVQFTQGNSAIIRDLGAMFAMGGIKGVRQLDEKWNTVAKIDLGVALTKAGLTTAGVVGGVAVGVLGAPMAGVGIGVGGWAIGDLLWEGWSWVRDNLLDQHGCYIQYLNKDGLPMDAGLSYYQGVAVGTNHSIALFPKIMGITPARVPIRDPNGNYRITVNELLTSLGWTELETLSLYRETSMFVNMINKEILKVSGRDPEALPASQNFVTIKGEILSPTGEEISNDVLDGIIDGDTLRFRVLDSAPGYPSGKILTIRLLVVNTAELEYKGNYVGYNPDNDLGKLAYDYLKMRFTNPIDRKVVIRIDKSNAIDNPRYNRTLAVVFHNAPVGTDPAQRLTVLNDFATRYPYISFDSYMEDGRPYTLNWELVMTGYGNVDMRDSIWDSPWRDPSLTSVSQDQ